MKILYVATVLSHICQFHLPYLKALGEAGNEIHVAARDNLAEKNGLTLKFADKFNEIGFQRSPADKRNLGAYKELKSLLSSEKFGVIVCNTPMGGIITRLAARNQRKNGTKVIYIAHGFHFYKGASKKAWLVYYPIEKAFAHLCDTVVTINKEDYELAKSKFSGEVKHIHGVGVREERYHPVSAEESAEMRKNEGLCEDDFVIVCTGEINKNKDQSTLISAAVLLKDKIPSLKVLLAGNGPLESELKARIERENLGDTVRMLGYRTDLEKVVPCCDLIVSCSHREGLGLNVIEAMLCKKAVVAAENRGHRELVDDGETGFLFKAGDVNALADKIYAVFSDESLRRKMGDKGYEKAQLYTVKAVEKEMIEIIC